MSGKHIYICSPSSAVRDKAAVRRGIKRLHALGHEVEVDPDAFTTHMRFAGDDATRGQHDVGTAGGCCQPSALRC